MTNDIQSNKENFNLLKATNKANPSDADKKLLKTHLAENPHVWQGIADLSGRLEQSIVKKFSESHLVQESYKHKLAAMRDNLGWAEANELERILIEQICLNWLRHHYMEICHFEKTRESHTPEAGIYWERILSGAQKRYLNACESLAKVRKLLAEANYRDSQAQVKRNQSAAIVKGVLKESVN